MKGTSEKKKTQLASLRGKSEVVWMQAVDYLRPEEVYRMVEYARNHGYKKSLRERNALMILTLFESGLRVSECIALTPAHLTRYKGYTCIKVASGKGKKPRLVAIPESLYNRLLAFARERNLSDDERFFPIGRKCAHQLVSQIGKKALGRKVWPHLLRHSHAIHVLRQTGHPRALQLHLGHASMSASIRYIATLAMEDAIEIISKVKFEE